MHLVSKGIRGPRTLFFGSRISSGIKGITAAKRRKSRKRTEKIIESLDRLLSFFDVAVKVVMQ